MGRLLIIGASGFGVEVYAWALQSIQFGKEWVVGGFLDDYLDALKDRNIEVEIISRIDDYLPLLMMSSSVLWATFWQNGNA